MHKNPVERAIRAQFCSYRASAKKRGIAFELTFAQFEKLVRVQECAYCGGNPSAKMGVDRIDNSIGYTPANSVSCCGFCNHMKSNLDLLTFVYHCTRVGEHIRKGIKRVVADVLKK